VSRDSGHVRLRGLVLSADGSVVVRVEGEGAPEVVGDRLAREALAAGAEEILAVTRGNGPLRGRRIVVTRPREQAHPLVEALQSLGAEVVVAPLVKIEPAENGTNLKDAMSDFHRYDWLVLTSANGVAALSEFAGAAWLTRNVRIAAVGPATAAAIEELGAEAAFVPERFAADEIAGGLGPLEDARVLLLQSDIASTALEKELLSRGARVDVIRAYRTVSVEPREAEMDELASGADAIVLASGSAARSLAELADSSPDVRNAIERALLVCIGPKTAAAAADAGLSIGLVAEEATADGIIHALTSHFGKSTQP
jgi:uroporphyrinogen-III synthase